MLMLYLVVLATVVFGAYVAFVLVDAIRQHEWMVVGTTAVLFLLTPWLCIWVAQYLQSIA